MVHVVNVLVSKTLNVLAELDSLLDVLVVGRVLGEDGVVDDHAVDALVIVGLHDLLLEELLVNRSEVELEAAMLYISARPRGITRQTGDSPQENLTSLHTSSWTTRRT